MCYSARIRADYRRYVRAYGAKVSMREFYDLFWRRLQGERILVPKAVEDAFVSSPDADDAPVADLIRQWRAQQANVHEQELFRQRRRLADQW